MHNLKEWVGNVIHNRDMGLALLGGEDYLPEVVDDQREAINESSHSSNRDAYNEVTDEPNVDGNEHTDRNKVDPQMASEEVVEALGARPKRSINKPKKYNDFCSYIGKVETLFMAANIQQRKSIRAALSLHLEVCTKNCAIHDLYKYLIEQGHTLNEYYGEIPSSIKTNKNKMLKQSKVHFDNTVQCSDGGTDTLHSYKIVLHHTKQVLFLSNYYVDTSLKELNCVPLV